MVVIGTHCWLLRIMPARACAAGLRIIHHNPQPSSHTLPISANAIQGNQKLGAHSIAPRLCPPLADGDNDDYDNGEEDNGKGETLEECATILHCIFREFCCPPPC